MDESVDPCAQIQMDLSAMLDGELDPASVRRVMVHSDACPSCRAFLDGIRAQARSHRELHEVLTAAPDELVRVSLRSGQSAAGGQGTVLDSAVLVLAGELRKQLTENREQLARIFYELGRGFVLMGISPNFSRIVAREPVPIPDMCQRGRNLLDEVERLAGGEVAEDVGGEWVRARELFGEAWGRSPGENLTKGEDLLHEALMLMPEFHEARIYVGHVHHVCGRYDDACRQFERVLEESDDVGIRGFALFNLGNVYLDKGDLAVAERLFLQLIESGVVEVRPQFGLIYFNLALAYGMQERFEECIAWLERLDSELPHKRRMIAEEFKSRQDFVDTLSRHPQVYSYLTSRFPCWFPEQEAC